MTQETKKELNKKHPESDGDKMIRVRAKAEIKIIEEKADADQGIIEAYVSIFDNIDLVGDIIRRGAFVESLRKKLPKGVWMHNWEEPVAKTLVAEEDDKGLFIRAQFNLETQRGRESFSDIKFGIIDEFSIGFKILDYEWDENDNRIIKKVRLYEWSPVLAGANPDTELINVKKARTEKTEPEKKEAIVSYVDVDFKKMRVKIYYRDGKTERKKISYKYAKYLKSLTNKGVKVDSDAEPPVAENKGDKVKLLRIRQAIKQVDKACEYVLRITK
ncbi:MAG: HK97 family phage prohead protease [Candidatus Falkowbacteria bacterium]